MKAPAVFVEAGKAVEELPDEFLKLRAGAARDTLTPVSPKIRAAAMVMLPNAVRLKLSLKITSVLLCRVMSSNPANVPQSLCVRYIPGPESVYASGTK